MGMPIYPGAESESSSPEGKPLGYRLFFPGTPTNASAAGVTGDSTTPSAGVTGVVSEPEEDRYKIEKIIADVVRKQEKARIQKKIVEGNAWEAFRKWEVCASPLRMKYGREEEIYLSTMRSVEVGTAISQLSLLGKPQSVWAPIGVIIAERAVVNQIHAEFVDEAQRTCGPQALRPSAGKYAAASTKCESNSKGWR